MCLFVRMLALIACFAYLFLLSSLRARLRDLHASSPREECRDVGVSHLVDSRRGVRRCMYVTRRSGLTFIGVMSSCVHQRVIMDAASTRARIFLRFLHRIPIILALERHHGYSFFCLLLFLCLFAHWKVLVSYRLRALVACYTISAADPPLGTRFSTDQPPSSVSVIVTDNESGVSGRNESTSVDSSSENNSSSSRTYPRI